MPFATARALTLVTTGLLLQACSVAPQLASAAAGCYGVQLGPVPAALTADDVPPLPERIALDTAFGGQVLVPRTWLEAQGLNMRTASLTLLQPGWRLSGGRLVVDRSRPRPLPPDTLILSFAGGAAASLTAVLAADADGAWRGWAFAPQTNVSTAGPPLVPFRLERAECGHAPMALAR